MDDRRRAALLRRAALPLLIAGGLLAASCSTTSDGDVAADAPQAPAGSPGGAADLGTGAPSPAPGADADPAAPSPGSDPVLPSLEVIDVRTGEPVDLASVSTSGPTLLWFWAPHCTRCRAEAPDVEALATGAGGDLAVVGLGAKDDLAQGQDFIADTGVTFPMVWDDDGALWREYGITAQPAAVLLDASGAQVDRWQGRIDPGAVSDAVAAL